MSTQFVRTWTGTDLDLWPLDTSGGWSKVYGGADDANIVGNAGRLGTIASERVYATTSYPNGTGLYAEVDITWNNAAGQVRAGGLALRVQDAGATFYTVELDSNTGTTRARIRRKFKGGAFADVVSWQAVTAGPSILNAGVAVRARIKTNEDGDVEITVWINGTQEIDTTDTHASRITTGGTVGVYIDAVATGNDFVFDNLTVEDLEDDATAPADLGAGWSIIVDGVHYSEAEIVAAGVLIGTGGQSYTDDPGFTFRDSLDWDDEGGIVYPGAIVTVKYDGDVVAFGRLTQADTAIDPGEGHAFTLEGPRTLARDVEINDPVLDTPRIAMNFPQTSDEYDEELADLGLGDAIQTLLEIHAPRLRRALAYPATGDGWRTADITALNAGTPIPQIVATGDVVRAIESLLAYTDRALFINPETRVWEFHDREPSGSVAVSLDDDHVTAAVKVDATKAYTQVLIRGTAPKATMTTVSTKDGSLLPGWDAGLEANATLETKQKDRDTGLVQGIGVHGSGYVSMDPDETGPPAFSMALNEWVRARLTFTTGAEAGNAYRVRGNTASPTSQFVFERTSWISGGPSPGDTFVVSGDIHGGGRSNGYKAVGRRWVVADPTKRVAEDACAIAGLEQGTSKWDTGVFIETPPGEDSEATEQQGVITAMPAIGALNFQSGGTVEDDCTPGTEGTIAEVTIDLPLIDINDMKVPTLLVPGEDQYRGPAYAKDPAAWDGGGLPTRGDLGVTRRLPIAIPEFDGSAAHVAAYTTFADSILAIVGRIPVEATITIEGRIDTSWLGLNTKIELTSTQRTIPAWINEALVLLAWEIDAEGCRTILYVGSSRAGSYDIDAQRRKFQAASRFDESQKRIDDIKRLLDCLSNSRKSAAGLESGPSPTYTPDCAVSLTGGGRGGTLGSSNDKECLFPPSNDPCDPSCNLWPCKTTRDYVDVGQLGNPPTHANWLQNAAFAVGDDGHGGTVYVKGSTTAEWVAYAMRHIACLWSTMDGMGSAHDQELFKAFTDLGNVRVQTEALRDCVNDNFEEVCDRIQQLVEWVTCWQDYWRNIALPTISACFAAKADAVGQTPCPLDVDNCVLPEVCDIEVCGWAFTETVCDPTNCTQMVPNVGRFESLCLEP